MGEGGGGEFERIPYETRRQNNVFRFSSVGEDRALGQARREVRGHLLMKGPGPIRAPRGGAASSGCCCGRHTTAGVAQGKDKHPY